ncbi:MAG: MFS transporter [Candidatus Micrarchaeota archaeon]
MQARTKPKHGFKDLLLVYILWVAAWSPVSSMLYVYLFNSGMPIADIFLSSAFVYLASLLTIPLFRGFTVKNFMIAGFVISALSILSLFLLPMPYAGFVHLFLSGTTCFIFWVPFNTMYFEHRKGNNAQLGALYYAISPITSLLLPFLSGWFAQSFGFPVLFALSALVFLAAAALAFPKIENRRYPCSYLGSLKAISGLKTMFFLEGFAGMVMVSVTLPVMLLLFTDKPFEIGAFNSLLTIFAVAAMFVTAKMSDLAEKRRGFILPVVLMFALSAVLASLADGIMLFFLASGLVGLFSRIFFPLPFALAVDNSKDLASTMVGREIMLNLGRLSGILAAHLIIVNYSIQAALLFQGAALLLYIPIFENRKHKLERH